MNGDFPFVRGEFLTRANKFVYIQESEKWIASINRQLEIMDQKSLLYNRLVRQRERLEEKIVSLHKSIEADISASREPTVLREFTIPSDYDIDDNGTLKK